MEKRKNIMACFFCFFICICSIFAVGQVTAYGADEAEKKNIEAIEESVSERVTSSKVVTSSALIAANCNHIFYDYGYLSPVKDPIVLYANGGVVKEAENKIDYKNLCLYTDILASYSYQVNTKGAVKPGIGKVVAGITLSSEKPVLVKGKIVDKEAQKIAKAKIRNGQVTVTAQKVPGLVYLWIMDTGNREVYESCPIHVLAAPSKINLYPVSDYNSGFSFYEKQYKKDSIEIGKETRVYVYPYYKDGNENKKAETAVFTAEVEAKASGYFSVEQDGENPFCFVIRASALNNGKKVSGKITFICKQNGKKAVFTATATIPKFSKKSLVAYFSCTGTTEGIAKKIADVASADLYEIEPKIPYTRADLNYNNDNSRANKEQSDPFIRPAIESNAVRLDDYEVIFIGYPIWHGQAPRIISTFLESYQWNGKTIVPFCTSGGSGMGNSAWNIQALADGNPVWLSGERFGGMTSKSKITEWVNGLDFS